MIPSLLARPLTIFVVILLVLGASASTRLDAETSIGFKRKDHSPESKHWREAQSCGVACGYMLARLLGRDVEYHDAVAAIPIESGGTSLLALQQGLRSLRVSTQILRAKPNELDRLVMPVIAHMLPRHEASDSVGHFLLILQIDERSVRYIEPNYAASIETVPRNQFLRCWTGFLVAPTARKTGSERFFEFVLWGVFAASISIGGGPAIRSICGVIWSRWQRSHSFRLLSLVATGCLLSGCIALPCTVNSGLDVPGRQPGPEDTVRMVAWNTEADLGVLPREGAAEALFRIENQGDTEVRLHLGSPTCRCTQGRIEAEGLKPGESTNVHMVMHSRPRQTGPADARVYLEAEGGRWAELLSVHAVQLGADFPDYTYLIGGPPSASRSASVVGNLFLKSSTTLAKLNVSLTGTGLESVAAIRDLHIGSPIDIPGCVRRECSFTVALNSKANFMEHRREIMLPISVNIDGETSTHHIRLTVLPSRQVKISAAGFR
jgi:hypothetical protein